VIKYCQDEHLGYFNYLQFYYCASNQWETLKRIVIIVFWLGLLFFTIGIAASDYLCPNLSTISKMLGLSESLAGVTFLAFGNGSPDVFSTYAAMRVGSGSLAIGELIGAASFITAVVTGSMAIVRPFKVLPYSFIRDAGFFLLAISFSMYFVSDRVLRLWECALMFAMYVVYVLIIVVWHWYDKRQREMQALLETRIMNINQEEGIDSALLSPSQYSPARQRETYSPAWQTQNEMYVPDSPALDPNSRSSTPFSVRSAPMWDEQTEEEQEEAFNELNRIMQMHRTHQRNPHFNLESQVRPVSSGHSSGSRSPVIPIRNSLLNAIEIRSVLKKLSQDRRDSNIHFRRSLSPTHDADSPIMNEGLISHPRFSPSFYNRSDIPSRRPTLSNEPSFRSLPAEGPSSLLAPPPLFISQATTPSPHKREGLPEVPKLVITVSQGEQENTNKAVDYEMGEANEHSRLHSPLSMESSPLLSSLAPVPQIFAPTPRVTSLQDEITEVITTLCPSLFNLSSKPWLAWFSCIVTAPFICLMTVTVPVIESDAVSTDFSTVEVVTESETATQNPESHTETLETKTYIPLVRWLLILQAFLGPLFVLCNWFIDNQRLSLLTIYSLLITAGFLGLINYIKLEPFRAPVYMQSLAFVGFIIAISWVSLIANEVVGVLKALGIILHISDAVMGLTVFAIGNSLGDLISNTTIAKMGFPMMALSACFGGPMLNILVGVGISGLVAISSSPKTDGYHVELSHTLIISGVTLFITLLFWLISVPLNDWKLTRTLGLITVLFWFLATAINIIFELIVGQ
jgi:sodium/potassium/calcium exchanger 6